MDTLFAFIGSAALLGLAGLGWLYRNERERRRSIEEKLSKEKWDTYLIFIDAFFDMVGSVRDGKGGGDNKKLLGAFDKFRRRLVVYGSDEVLGAFMEATSRTESQSDFGTIGEAYSNVIAAIRKDMGNHRTRFSALDVMRLLMNADFRRAIAENGELRNMYLKYRRSSLRDWGNL